MKQMRSGLFAGLLGAICFCFGCEKSPTKTAEPVVPYATSAQTVARVHWLGKRKIAASTNSASLMKIWSGPESVRLQTQTLDKLSTAPWRLIAGVATTNTEVAPLLRAILDDCIEEESYLEIRHATNQAAELAFAIRLGEERAALWQTNLAAVLESLTGLKTQPQLLSVGTESTSGWSLKRNAAPHLIELARASDWVVIGLGEEKNTLLADLVSRIYKNHSPASAVMENWLDIEDLNLREFSDALGLGFNLPKDFPRVSGTVSGDGLSVQTHAQLNFSDPLQLPLDAWILPTNLIRGYVSSFTAMRGFGPWVEPRPAWTNLMSGPAPNQLFVWAGAGIPLQTLFAMPMNDATNRTGQISDALVRQWGSWLETHDSGHLEKAATGGLSWIGMPFLAPSFRAEDGFLTGGFFPNAGKKLALPAEVLAQLGRTNMVYYDWELTGPRIESWFYIGQTLRLILHRPQLPSNSASTAWLQSNTNSLGPCVTAAFESGPAEISISRRSAGVGLTAFELHLIGDWLESPTFPAGLHTLSARAEVLRGRPRPATPPAHP